MSQDIRQPTSILLPSSKKEAWLVSDTSSSLPPSLPPSLLPYLPREAAREGLADLQHCRPLKLLARGALRGTLGGREGGREGGRVYECRRIEMKRFFFHLPSFPPPLPPSLLTLVVNGTE